MKWITWDQAAISAVVSTLIFLIASKLPRNAVTNFAVAAGKEMAFLSTIYSLWRLARQLPIASEEGALDRARSIAQFQSDIFLPSELGLQHFVIDREWLAEATTWYYAVVHVPSLIVFMVWLFMFRRPFYKRWRTALSVTTFFCLVIRFVRVAPPRFIPELGFVNLSDQIGIKVYGSVGSGVSDQYAAMPSIHIAWAGIVTCGVIAACTGRWRWLMLLHLGITFFVVAATGHHWWLDGIVAMGLIGLSLLIDSVGRQRFGGKAAPVEPELSSDDEHSERKTSGRTRHHVDVGGN